MPQFSLNTVLTTNPGPKDKANIKYTSVKFDIYCFLVTKFKIKSPAHKTQQAIVIYLTDSCKKTNKKLLDKKNLSSLS